MKKSIIYLIIIALFGCNNNQRTADAYGNFEADEITISAQTTGKIQYFKVKEGERIQEGQLLAFIDTTHLHLQKRKLIAQQNLIKSRIPGILTQIEVLAEQKKNALRELKRFQTLAKEGAATQKQVDDLQDRIQVLEKQILNVRSQNEPILQEYEMVEVQIEQVLEQIDDAQVKAPVNASVLLKISEEHELASPGKPLLRIANLDTLNLRVFVSGSQLDDIAVNQQVTVLIDQDKNSYRQFTGRLIWIADQAEFTPKTIQTKNERVDLVYAVKIRVANDQGRLKIGMPAEVIFNNPENNEDHDRG